MTLSSLFWAFVKNLLAKHVFLCCFCWNAFLKRTIDNVFNALKLPKQGYSHILDCAEQEILFYNTKHVTWWHFKGKWKKTTNFVNIAWKSMKYAVCMASLHACCTTFAYKIVLQGAGQVRERRLKFFWSRYRIPTFLVISKVQLFASMYKYPHIRDLLLLCTC